MRRVGKIESAHMKKPRKIEIVAQCLSLEEADRADREYYRSLTPNERLAIVAELMRMYYGPPRRLERVLEVAELPRG